MFCNRVAKIRSKFHHKIAVAFNFVPNFGRGAGEKFFVKNAENICTVEKIELTLHRKSPEGHRIRFNSSVG